MPPSPFTRAYEDHLLKALIYSTVQDVSQKEGVRYDAVLGVLDNRVQATVDWSRFTRLDIIGIDALALTTGQRDYAVLVSARLADKELALLAVLPDRKTETVRVLLWRSFGLFKLDRLFQHLWLDVEGPRVFGYAH